MSRKVEYTNEPMGTPKVIRDLLPSPEELAFRDEDVTITITITITLTLTLTLTLSKKSVDFFKTVASQGNIQDRRMIRRLLDAHAGAPARGSPRARAKEARAA